MLNDQNEFCKAQSFLLIFSTVAAGIEVLSCSLRTLLLLVMDALSHTWKYHFLFFYPWGEITQILIWQMCLWNKTEISQFMRMVSFWYTITKMKQRNLGFHFFVFVFLVETKNEKETEETNSYLARNTHIHPVPGGAAWLTWLLLNSN